MQWYYATGGERHGPVSLEMLRNLVLSNELQPTDLVWQAGMPNWVPLSSVYPLLGIAQPSTPAQPTPPVMSSRSQPDDSPYKKPHRGGLLLTLSLLGFLCCGLIGPFVWYMASQDLNEMRHGIMDRSGEGITQAAYIIGIITTILTIISIPIFLIMLALS